MTFNDYLKYVTGHAKENSGIYSYADRLITAINRVFAEKNITDRYAEPDSTEIDGQTFIDIVFRTNNKKYTVIADFSDFDIIVTYKAQEDIEFDDVMSKYVDCSLSSKNKVFYDLESLIKYCNDYYISNKPTDEEMSDEAVNYIINGLNSIGASNSIINVMVIYTIKALEFAGYFDTDDDNN
jgi:hypothetical protein